MVPHYIFENEGETQWNSISFYLRCFNRKMSQWHLVRIVCFGQKNATLRYYSSIWRVELKSLFPSRPITATKKHDSEDLTQACLCECAVWVLVSECIFCDFLAVISLWFPSYCEYLRRCFSEFKFSLWLQKGEITYWVRESLRSLFNF